MRLTPASTVPEGGEPTISIEAAARLLEISSERIRQLIKADYIPRPAPGKTTLVGAVRGYLKFLTDESRRANISAAEGRVRFARAAEIEIRVEDRLRDLLPRAEVDATNTFVVAVLNAELDGLPARLSRDAATRRKYEIEIERTRGRINRALSEATACLETGRPLPHSGADSDV